ncbi:hypothetical protein TRVL_08981 [Trypanosoma vivax]|nr:hypothetical protein TRVL_08981 [Trypanosoma vivax]
MDHKTQGHRKLCHKLGRLERGRTGDRSSTNHLQQGIPPQKAAATCDGEQSSTCGNIASSATRKKQEGNTEIRTKAQDNGEGSVLLEPGGGKARQKYAETSTKGRHTKDEDGRDCARQLRTTIKTLVLSGLARARAEPARYDSKAENERSSISTSSATIASAPILPNEARAQAVPHNTPPGEGNPKKGEAEHSSPKVERVGTAANLCVSTSPQ